MFCAQQCGSEQSRSGALLENPQATCKRFLNSIHRCSKVLLEVVFPQVGLEKLLRDLTGPHCLHLSLSERLRLRCFCDLLTLDVSQDTAI